MVAIAASRAAGKESPWRWLLGEGGGAPSECSWRELLHDHGSVGL